MTLPNLERKDLKLFANDAAAQDNIAVFGSLASANPQFSKDIEAIQNLPAFLQGWAGAITGDASPALEDFNALFYVLFYQMAYLFQKGVAQWKATTDYYNGSFTTDGNGALYASIVDNNVGNDPATDDGTHWVKFPTPAEVDSKVSKSGDTMTGALNVPTPSESENSTVVPTTAWVKKFLNDKLGKVYFSQSSSASDNPGALPLFTGETIASANTIYPDFYNWVSAHTELQCTAEEYESALSTYGECAKYVIGGGSLRLPLIKNYIKAANPSEGIKNIEAGLPNITGNIGRTFASQNSGAFYTVNTTSSAQGGSGGGVLHGFDASRSSDVYGKSSTVTPASTTLYPWVVAYAAAVPASTAQAAEFQQGLSGKADTNLENTTPSQSFKEMSVGWGMPDYTNGVAVNIPLESTNTTWESPSNGYLSIVLSGSYMNHYKLKANGNIIWQSGDDINSNSKEAGVVIPVKKGVRLNYVSPGYAFENITTTFYAV